MRSAMSADPQWLQNFIETPARDGEALSSHTDLTGAARMAYHRSVLPPAIDAYVRSVGARETPIQARLRDATASLPQAAMQIGADEAGLLALLVKLTGARKAL